VIALQRNLELQGERARRLASSCLNRSRGIELEPPPIVFSCSDDFDVAQRRRLPRFAEVRRRHLVVRPAATAQRAAEEHPGDSNAEGVLLSTLGVEPND